MGNLAYLPGILPWANGTFLVFVVAALLLARPTGRWLATPSWATALLILALGLVVALTLTPRGLAPHEAYRPLNPLATSGSSPMFRPPWQWWDPVDRRQNILIFIPLAFPIAFVGTGRSRRLLILLALAMPWAVEGIQRFITPLHRDMQWQDIVDNTIGVLLGLGAGWAVQAWLRRRTVVHGRDGNGPETMRT